MVQSTSIQQRIVTGMRLAHRHHPLHRSARMDERSRKYIAKYVEDLHSLVAHGLQPFSQQLAESQLRDHPHAQQAIQDFHTTLQQHERLLKLRLEALGSSPTTGVQDAASAVAGVVAGLYNQVRSEAVSK